MKERKISATRAATAMALMCATLLLAGCATPNDHAGHPGAQAIGGALTIPPGQRLEKFTLCYEMRYSRASPLEQPVKRFSIEVSLLVPQDDCLALDANGWLRVVPGQCSRVPARSSCEEEP